MGSSAPDGGSFRTRVELCFVEVCNRRQDNIDNHGFRGFQHVLEIPSTGKEAVCMPKDIVCTVVFSFLTSLPQAVPPRRSKTHRCCFLKKAILCAVSKIWVIPETTPMVNRPVPWILSQKRTSFSKSLISASVKRSTCSLDGHLLNGSGPPCLLGTPELALLFEGVLFATL